MNNLVSLHFPITLIVLAIAVIALFVVLSLYLPLLTRVIFPKFGYRKYSDYLPFYSVINDNLSIKLNNGTFVRGYSFNGTQASMQDETARAQYLDLRASLLNQIKDSGIILRFLTTRDFMSEKTDYEFGNDVLQKIYNQWNSSGLKMFSNRHFVLITANSLDKLNQYGGFVESVMAAYGPRACKHNDPANNLAVLFGRILSPLSKPRPKRCDGNIAELTTADAVEFGRSGLVRYSAGGYSKYSVFLSFKTAPDFLDEEFFTELGSLQCEILSFNNITTMGYAGVEKTIKQTASTTDSSEIKSDIVGQQLAEAVISMDENVSGAQSMVSYYASFQIFANSPAELEENINNFKKICANYGITPVVEDFAAKVSFFAQIPGFDNFPRQYKLLSRTAALSFPMASVPTGVPNSDWGPGPLVIFPTAQGTPYQFQFHVNDKPGAVGHSIVIGPTGSGKTALFSFLISQALRHQKLKAFFFDRNRGAEIFTLAAGGKYMTFEGEENSGFNTKLNPFRMEDSGNNRAFLRRWLAMISGQTDAGSLDEISRAVSVAFDYIPENERSLKNLWKSCFSSGGPMRGALKKWVDDLQYGGVFNEEKDTLDLQSRLTTFDFTEIFSDPVLAPAVISYIIHRINNMTTRLGAPSLIMIDETAPMLENEMFRNNFITGLQEGRKNRQAYMAAFQRANVLDKLGIGDAVRGQAQTVIFFRNPAADLSDYGYWKLNPLEMAFIQGKAYPQLKYAVLLSRPINGESVILHTDLGGLGPMLKLFESGRPNVLLAEDLYKQYGNQFVGEYLRKTVQE
ncbi:MAG: hypothetical protein LBO08_03200 [Rickettsiales bacterium]|jgi:type IV secretion system protein VirB4|nr:hypothetical protein [Rickettsiales bacterium]